MKLSFAIIENEKKRIDIYNEYFLRYEKENNIEIKVESFSNGYDFLESKNTYHACFMDIDMPGINGIETSFKLREKDKNIDIIFITNLPQFAIEGYKVHAFDFVLKPIIYEDFRLCLNKLKSKYFINKGSFIIEQKSGEIRKFLTEEVVSIEMISHDVTINLLNGETYSFRGALRQIESKLNSEYFYKCNSGIIVNLMYVSSYNNGEISLINNKTYPVSRSHKGEIMEVLAKYFSKNS